MLKTPQCQPLHGWHCSCVDRSICRPLVPASALMVTWRPRAARWSAWTLRPTSPWPLTGLGASWRLRWPTGGRVTWGRAGHTINCLPQRVNVEKSKKWWYLFYVYRLHSIHKLIKIKTIKALSSSFIIVLLLTFFCSLALQLHKQYKKTELGGRREIFIM